MLHWLTCRNGSHTGSKLQTQCVHSYLRCKSEGTEGLLKCCCLRRNVDKHEPVCVCVCVWKTEWNFDSLVAKVSSAGSGINYPQLHGCCAIVNALTSCCFHPKSSEGGKWAWSCGMGCAVPAMGWITILHCTAGVHVQCTITYMWIAWLCAWVYCIKCITFDLKVADVCHACTCIRLS